MTFVSRVWRGRLTQESIPEELTAAHSSEEFGSLTTSATKNSHARSRSSLFQREETLLRIYVPVEGDIERRGRMSQCPDADAIDAGLGDLADVRQGDPARRF